MEFQTDKSSTASFFFYWNKCIIQPDTTIDS